MKHIVIAATLMIVAAYPATAQADFRWTGRVDPGQWLKISNVNGDVEANWLSGGIDSEFPLTVRGRVGGSARGQLGSGGPTISLDTVNGRIAIS